MLIALDSQNHYVQADLIKEKNIKGSLFCPGCRQPVYLKRGKIKIPHFSHYQASDCFLFSEGETLEHLAGKQMLSQWFTQQEIPCMLEAYLPKLKQRPDLLIWLDQKIPVAIEFQCSFISEANMIKRTQSYQKAGYKVIWILGKRFKLKRKLTAQQRLFLYYHKNLNYHIFFLDTNHQKLHIFYHLIQFERNELLKSRNYQVSLTNKKITLKTIINHFETLTYQPYVESEIAQTKELLKNHQFLMRALRNSQSKLIDFQRVLYQAHHHLLFLPIELHLPIEQSVIIQMQNCQWKYQVVRWLSKKGENQVFTSREYVQNMMIQLLFYPTPLITKKIQQKELIRYLYFLETQQIIHQIAHHQWVVLKKLVFFNSEEEKLMELTKNTD